MRDDEAALTRAIIELASAYGRYGVSAHHRQACASSCARRAGR